MKYKKLKTVRFISDVINSWRLHGLNLYPHFFSRHQHHLATRETGHFVSDVKGLEDTIPTNELYDQVYLLFLIFHLLFVCWVLWFIIFKKRAIFDILFTFLVNREKTQNSFRTYLTYKNIRILLTLLTFLPYQFCKYYELMMYDFSLMRLLVLILICAILDQLINNTMVSKI